VASELISNGGCICFEIKATASMGKYYQLNHSYSARSSSSAWSIKREIHAAALPKDDAMVLGFYRYGWKSLDKACQKKTWMGQLSALAIHVEQLDKHTEKSFVYVVYEKFRPLHVEGRVFECRYNLTL
jgi:hypothetical protein